MRGFNHPAGRCYGIETDPRDAPVITVLSERTVTARKAHTCDVCDETISRGQRYVRTAIINDDGEFEAHKHHSGGCPAHNQGED